MLFFVCTNKLTAQQSIGKINRNDLVVLENNKVLSESDIRIINDYKFDEYRFMNIRKKVQLMNGPLIELLSIKELEKKGISVSQDIITVAMEKSESFKHEVTLLLNIGLGITYATSPY